MMINNLISFFTKRNQERGPTFRDMHLTIVSLLKENTNIRAENERLREALKETLAIASRNEADAARAALESVTKKEETGNE